MSELGTLQTTLDSARPLSAKSFAVLSGAVKGKPAQYLTLLKRRVPAWRRDGATVSAGLPGAPPAAGALYGAVTTLGAPSGRIVVRLYYRINGVLIDSALTSPDGLFSFPQLDSSDVGNYFVVAFDDESGVQYNAIIFDRLTPVE